MSEARVGNAISGAAPRPLSVPFSRSIGTRVQQAAVAPVAVLSTLVVWVVRLFATGGERYSHSAYYVPDDVFIDLVYARHLARHGQFYWNATDGPIDGFTSMLDLLIKSAAIWLFPRVDPLAVAWALTIGYCVLLAAVAALLAVAVAPGLSPWHRVLFGIAGGVAISTQAGFSECVYFLLETPLFVVVCLLVIGLFVGRSASARPPLRALPVLLFVLSLTRPEGFFLSWPVLGFFVWTFRDRVPGRQLIMTVVAYAAAMAIFFAFRIGMFGYWAPNTYYAKVSAHRWNEVKDGLTYVLAFVRACRRQGLVLLWLLFSPALLLSRDFRDERARRNFGLVVFLALGALGLLVVGGGDCYPGARFFALPLMLSTLALVIAAGKLEGLSGRLAQWGLAHQPFAGQVLWGKATEANALAADSEIWICGCRPFGGVNRPLARLSTAELFGDPAVLMEYTGLPPGVADVTHRIVARYATASLPACGGYFNFLARRDIAAALVRQGVLVGG
jgi:hypothetical protein